MNAPAASPGDADTREMKSSEPQAQLAIEVGTSCIKLGKFAAGGCPSDKPASALPVAAPALPQPVESLSLFHNRNLSGAIESDLAAWLTENFPEEPRCCFASVQPTVSAHMVQLIEKIGWDAPRQLTWRDMPLEVRVDEVARVGIDRLLDAVAANTLREPGRPAIVVDLGTAGTVNLLGADGAFEGGAILSGMALSAQALHTGTSSLPQVDTPALAKVDAVGKNTSAAIAAGVYWGLVGAVNVLVDQMARRTNRTPHLFVTGGAAPQVVEHLHVGGEPARHVPHMVLSAIRLVAEQLR